MNSGGQVRSCDVEPGRILWLPTAERIREVIDESGGRLSMPNVINSNSRALPIGKGYKYCKHPILVLSKPDKNSHAMQFAVVGLLSNLNLGTPD